MSLIPKNRQIWQRVRAAKFSFSNNQKIENLQCFSFTSKITHQKEKKKFGPRNGQHCLSRGQRKKEKI